MSAAFRSFAAFLASMPIGPHFSLTPLPPSSSSRPSSFPHVCSSFSSLRVFLDRYFTLNQSKIPEFLENLQELSGENEEFERLLIAMEQNGSDSSSTGEFSRIGFFGFFSCSDSFLGLLISLTALKAKIATFLLQKLMELQAAGSEEENTENIKKLIFSHLRHLDCLPPTEAPALLGDFLNALDILAESLYERDLLAIIPQVFPDALHEEISTTFLALLASRPSCTGALIDALTALNLSNERNEEILEYVLNSVENCSLDSLPIVIRFLFQFAEKHQVKEIWLCLRKNLSFALFGIAGKTQKRGNAGLSKDGLAVEDESNPVIIVDSLRVGLEFNPAFCAAVLDDLAAIHEPSDHRILDVWLSFFILRSAKFAKRAETLLKKKFSSGEFPDSLLEAAVVGHCEMLRAIFPTLLAFSSGCIHVAASFHVRQCGARLLVHLFHSFSDSSHRRDLISSFLHHIGSNSASEISAALQAMAGALQNHTNRESWREFYHLLKGILDYLEGFSPEQIRLVYKILTALAVRALDGAGGLAVENSLEIIIKKELNHSDLAYQLMGIIGSVCVLEALEPSAGPSEVGDSANPKAVSWIDSMFSRFEKHPNALAILLDELAHAIRSGALSQQIIQEIQSRICSLFQRCFPVEFPAAGESGRPRLQALPPQFFSHLEGRVVPLGSSNSSSSLSPALWMSLDSENLQIALNLLALSAVEDRNQQSNLVFLCPALKLFVYCEDSLNSSVDSIDALLGCPAALFSPLTGTQFEALPAALRWLAICSLLHLINWFRTLVNSFRVSLLTPSMKAKVACRLRQTLQLEDLLGEYTRRIKVSPGTLDEIQNTLVGLNPIHEKLQNLAKEAAAIANFHLNKRLAGRAARAQKGEASQKTKQTKQKKKPAKRKARVLAEWDDSPSSSSSEPSSDSDDSDEPKKSSPAKKKKKPSAAAMENPDAIIDKLRPYFQTLSMETAQLLAFPLDLRSLFDDSDEKAAALRAADEEFFSSAWMAGGPLEISGRKFEDSDTAMLRPREFHFILCDVTEKLRAALQVEASAHCALPAASTAAQFESNSLFPRAFGPAEYLTFLDPILPQIYKNSRSILRLFVARGPALAALGGGEILLEILKEIIKLFHMIFSSDFSRHSMNRPLLLHILRSFILKPGHRGGIHSKTARAGPGSHEAVDSSSLSFSSSSNSPPISQLLQQLGEYFHVFLEIPGHENFEWNSSVLIVLDELYQFLYSSAMAAMGGTAASSAAAASSSKGPHADLPDSSVFSSYCMLLSSKAGAQFDFEWGNSFKPTQTAIGKILRIAMHRAPDRLEYVQHFLQFGFLRLAAGREPEVAVPLLNEKSFPLFYGPILEEFVVAFEEFGTLEDFDGDSQTYFYEYSRLARTWNELLGVVKSLTRPAAVAAALRVAPKFLTLVMQRLNFEKIFKKHEESIVTLLKTLQGSTRLLHHACTYAKEGKFSSLTASIPRTKKVLESFIYRVKKLFKALGLVSVFSQGNLRPQSLGNRPEEPVRKAMTVGNREEEGEQKAGRKRKRQEEEEEESKEEEEEDEAADEDEDEDEEEEEDDRPALERDDDDDGAQEGSEEEEEEEEEEDEEEDALTGSARGYDSDDPYA